jgi:hypothetical protein
MAATSSSCSVRVILLTILVPARIVDPPQADALAAELLDDRVRALQTRVGSRPIARRAAFT